MFVRQGDDICREAGRKNSGLKQFLECPLTDWLFKRYLSIKHFACSYEINF